MVLLQIIKDLVPLGSEALPETKFKMVKLLSPSSSGCSHGGCEKVLRSLSSWCSKRGINIIDSEMLIVLQQVWLQASWGEHSLPSLPKVTMVEDNYNLASSSD